MRVVTRVCAAAIGLALLWAAPVGAEPAPGKERCKNGGWRELGYENQGQCVKAANEANRRGEPFPPEGDGDGGNGGGGDGEPQPT